MKPLIHSIVTLSIKPTRLYVIVAAIAFYLALTMPAHGLVTIEDINPNRSDDIFSGSSGRVNGLASVRGNNQVYYAASEWGGLYKTKDGGRHWSHLDGHLPVAMWDVEVDPDDPDIVYATSFYDGRVNPLSGIQVSRDGGESWERPLTAFPDPDLEETIEDNTPQPGFDCAIQADRTEPSAFGIAILDTEGNSNNVIFVGTNCGVARSYDSGATWEFRDPGVNPNADPPQGPGDATPVWDVLAQRGGIQNRGIIDICTNEGHFRSVDGGENYSLQAGVLPGLTTDGQDNDGDCPGDTNKDGLVCGPGDLGVDEDDEGILPRGPLGDGKDNNGNCSGDTNSDGIICGHGDINVDEQLEGPVRCALAASPDEPYVLFLSVSGVNVDPNFKSRIFESDDAGNTWRDVTLITNARNLPFVATNNRQGPSFDLWLGEKKLRRGGCATPTNPQPGGNPRCPSSVYNDADLGAHVDVGDLAFDPDLDEDACPSIYSNDGGVYFNTKRGIGCEDPLWDQPDVSPHALWLFAMDGATRPGGDQEDLYLGTQDNGIWQTTTAGLPEPDWTVIAGGDVFDISANPDRVVWTTWPNTYLRILSSAGQNSFVFSPEFYDAFGNSFDGKLYTYQFQQTLDQFGGTRYVVLTQDPPGVFFTTDITVSPITWTQLGRNMPSFPYSIQASRVGPVPVFYLRAGVELHRLVGFNPNGIWQRIDNNIIPDSPGVSLFAVDPTDGNRVYASLFSSKAQLFFSSDSGQTWRNDPELDSLMSGNGEFKDIVFRGPIAFGNFNGYTQPTLLAFDPDENSNIIVAGGSDSGVFFSTNGGGDWSLLSDPFTPNESHIPHLPRPRYATFDHDTVGLVRLYIGTQGRGVWRLVSYEVEGDLNGDRCVDRSDLELFLTIIRDQSRVKPSWTFDLNSDWRINIADARRIVTLFTNPQGASCP